MSRPNKKKAKLLPIALKYSSIITILLIFVSAYLLMSSSNDLTINFVGGIFLILLHVYIYYRSIYDVKVNQKGYLSLNTGIKQGLLVNLLTLSMSAVIGALFFLVLVVMGINEGGFGLPDKMVFGPFILIVLFTIIYVLLTYTLPALILSLIISSILKKKEPIKI